jgi:diguanylate cyclase (GGDEF)-like protein
MTVFSITPPKTSHALLQRLVWWVVILMAGTVALGIFLVSVFARQADEDAGLAERNRLTLFVAHRITSLREILNTAARDLASGHEEILALAEPHFDFIGIGRHDEATSSFIWYSTRESTEFAAAHREALQRFGVSLADIGNATGVSPELFAFEDQLIVRLSVEQSAKHMLVGTHVLDLHELRRNADLAQATNLVILKGPIPENKNAVAIRDLLTGAQASLAWERSSPGGAISAMAISAAGPALLVIFLLFALVVVNTRRIAKELAASQAAAESLAGIDPLSGLPNRLLFGESLDQELAGLQEAGEGLSLMFLDLDRFKEVNDAHGHQAGDELIKQVARRLLTVLRGADTLSRFGGDEFAIMQPGITHDGEAEALARRILSALSTPFNLEGTAVDIGVSIGIALAPRHARDRETLMRLADTALYDAKSSGRNRFSLFVEQMDEAIRMRKVVADDLRAAISNDELTVYYQPIYSATGDQIVSLEALVRWPHPTQGMIQPGKFIPLAEQSGLVIPLGEWVLKRVCRDGHRWPGVKIAVNVSPIQFRQRDFVEGVLEIVQKAGVDPSRIELELTEGVVVEDADAAEAAIMQLRAHGFSLALDDFGSGYSSLIYLRRFAFDKIKIDRSFLESMEGAGESAILVHSIVHLGRALGLTVTAEGVETKEQHRFLQALGCHELQGFLFSKPVPIEEIDALLDFPDASLRASSAVR